MNINPRIVTELQGNWPASFDDLVNRIFYREHITEFGTAVWIPKSSIMDCQDKDIMALPIFIELKAAFEKHPEFDCITLSNT